MLEIVYRISLLPRTKQGVFRQPGKLGMWHEDVPK